MPVLYPCNCGAVTSEGGCDSKTCFCFCDLTVGPLDPRAIAACGPDALGSLDLLAGKDFATLCGPDPVVFTVHELSPQFFGAFDISAEGELSWRVIRGARAAFGTATIKATCGHRGTYFTVKIYRSQPCQGANCPTGLECDPCTGLCVDNLPGLSGEDLTAPVAVAPTAEATYTLPVDRLLDHVVVLRDPGLEGILTLGLSSGQADLITASIPGSGPTLLNVAAYADDGPLTIYINASIDVSLVFYTR